MQLDRSKFVASSSGDHGSVHGRPIAVLMSGGVDSSVTVLMLREAGWRVVGVTMKIPVLEGDPLRPCCGTDAASVARQLGVEHYFLDTEEAFVERVVAPFRDAYLRGATPSPCVECNAALKFSVVWDAIQDALGIDYLATGHYARIVHDGGVHRLARARDAARDQSYFLYGLLRERLPRLELPLGAHTKSDVRGIAESRGLAVSRKPDSMELCFAGEGDYRRLFDSVPPQPGPIRDKSGRILGKHKGIHFYTVGQRRGLPASTTGPLYVLEVRPESNSLVVGTRAEGFTARVRAEQVNVLAPELFAPQTRLSGKIRSTGDPAACTLVRADAGVMEVAFDSPVFAPAAGQHLVLYDEDGNVIAGGVIRV